MSRLKATTAAPTHETNGHSLADEVPAASASDPPREENDSSVEQPPPDPPADGLIVVNGADVVAKPVDWLWQDRIAAGMLVQFTGHADVGKSTVITYISACITAGRPFCDGAPCKRGRVLIYSPEDDPARVFIPRLLAAEGDPSRVDFIKGVHVQGEKDAVLLERDLKLMRAYVKKAGDVRLVVFDPLSGSLGERVDENSSVAVRRVLHPVVEWAEETGVAVLGISHASKASAGQAGVHRSLGSVALLAVCRTAWAVVRDDSDPDRRLFLPQKNNLARASGLAFRVEGVEVEGCQTHRLVWESEPVEMTLDDIKPEAHSPKKLEQAIEFLRATLTEPKLATEMYELAQQKGGISAKTLKRARAALGVGDEQRGGRHWWIPTPAMGAAAFRDAIAPSPEADAPPKSEGQKLLRQRANTTPDGQ